MENKKITLITLITLIIFIIVLIELTVYLFRPKQIIEITEIHAEKINFTFNDNQEHKRLIYEMIESESYPTAESHEYKLHRFDCTDFSNELKNKLIAKGLNAYCVFGLLKESNYPLHTWVEIRINEQNFIWVESTNGEIIEDRTNYKILSKTKRCI